MIKKSLLCTALSVTAFSGWAQDTSPDTLVVTANRFQQPVNTVLAPTDVVTREDIQRWQIKRSERCHASIAGRRYLAERRYG